MGFQYKNLDTEKINSETSMIDRCNTSEILHLINQEDAKVSEAVREAIPQIAQAVDVANPIP